MQGGVLLVANAGGFRVCFRPTGGISGIHMSEDYFGLGGDIGLKCCRMKGSVWGYQCV